MRRLLVLVAALAAMWFLGGLDVTPIPGALHPLTLAAIGFVVLAAFTVGELGATLGLPKVTGYIVAGVLLGPQAANILSPDVVDNLSIFNTLALGLIATTAGLELDLKAIGRVWKSLTAMVVLKIPLLLVLVGGAFYAMETFVPSLGLDPTYVVPLALTVAVLGIGTSPAIAIAVANDSGAKGRLTDLLLAIAVVKDVVVVVSLALVIALDKTLLVPGMTLDVHVITHEAEVLGRSILVGAVLGGLMAAYIKFVHKQMLLFVLLTILVAAEISHVYHLELLLVFIVAGFLVRNATPFEHELLHPLERIALPVFVVFFTTAGAAVDLLTTWSILPLALVLFAARVAAFYIAGRLGSLIGGEGPAIRDNAWLTFLPQAGVTLGLVLLAAQKLPQLAEPIMSIGLALVAINLLIGPITLGMGLKFAGETAGAGPGAQAPTDEPSIARELTEDTAEYGVGAPLQVPAVVVGPLGSAPAAAVLRELTDQLNADVAEFFTTTAEPAVAAVREAAVERLEASQGAAALESAALKPVEMPQVDWDAQIEALHNRLIRRIQDLPERTQIEAIEPPPAHNKRAQEGGLFAGIGRQVARLRAISDRRRPQLRMIARTQMEGRLAEGLHELFDSWYRNQAHLLELLLRAIEHDESVSVGTGRVSQAAEVWLRMEEDTLLRVIQAGLAATVDELVEHASPIGSPSRPRFSTVEPLIDDHLRAIHNDVGPWRDAVAATSEHVQAASLVAVGDARTRETLTRWGETAIDEVRRTALPRIDTTIAELQGIRARMDEDGEEDWSASLKRAFPVAKRLMLRTDGATFRQQTQPQALQNVMSPLVDSAPDRLRIVGGRRASRLDHPRQLQTREIRMSARLRAILLDELVPEAGRALAPLKSRITTLHRTVAEGVEVASFGVTEALRSTEEPNDIRGPVDRAITRLRAIRSELDAATEVARDRLRGEEDDTRNALEALLDARGIGGLQSGVAATRRSVVGWVANGRDWVLGLGSVVRGAQARLLDHPWLTDRAVRLGHMTVDGDAMRHAIAEAAPSSDIPADVLNLFAPRAVDDRRLFVAHKDALARLSQLLSRPDDHARLAALVVGKRGSGRTSFLNMLQLRARERQVVRLDESVLDRSSGVISALATELHTDPDENEVLQALSRVTPLVLIDNIERFLSPSVESVDHLDRVLGLVAASSAAGAEWVVTIEASLLQRLEDVIAVNRVFNQRVDLPEVDWRDLKAVMHARVRLGGVRVQHEYHSRVDSLLPGEPEDRYFKRLADVSAGNLAAAMRAHRGGLVDATDRVIRLKAPVAIPLPFVGDLAPLARASLAVLYPFGPMNLAELADSLGAPMDELFRHVQALRESGLLMHVGDADGRVTITPGLLDSVREELVRHRQISGEGVR